MKYGVLGTGDVAQVIANKLIELDHVVMMGSRTSNNEKAIRWKQQNGNRAHHGTFNDAAAFGERVFLCVQGIHSLEALKTVDQGNLKNKILVDLTNPYIYEDGHISLDSKYTNTTCLGEEVQKLIPNTKVVKTLDYIGSIMMTNPNRLSEAVTGFYCGNDEEAKKEIKELLKDFGWNETFDLGDISMSRYLEMLGAFWVPVFNQFGTMQWGLKLIKD